MLANRGTQGNPKLQLALSTTQSFGRFWFVLLVTAIALAQPTMAQQAPVHYFHSADLPPGTVGQGQLLRGGPLAGYFQPVDIRGPEGASISVAIAGQFTPSQPSPLMAGLLIGQVYRLKVTGIPRNEGFEVFPTIELVNRLYPPPGLDKHFPIPVELTLEELELALAGRYVTRVIYLEDPATALPVRDTPEHQRYFEVRSGEDPLFAADRLGRPVAILRMGSRTPAYDSLSQRFTFACPPLQLLRRPGPLPGRDEGLEEPLPSSNGGRSGNIPRMPLSAQSPFNPRMPY